MYTLTVHIAPKDTTYVNQDNGKVTKSAAGHMWYSITGPIETLSAGFGPVPNATLPFRAPGTPKFDDSAAYQGNFAIKTVQITQAQYETLSSFRETPEAFNFSRDYRGLANSCIDFTWHGLMLVGINPSGFQGNVIPTQNISAIKSALATFETSTPNPYVISFAGNEVTYTYNNGSVYKQNMEVGYRVWTAPSPDNLKVNVWTTTYTATVLAIADFIYTVFIKEPPHYEASGKYVAGVKGEILVQVESVSGGAGEAYSKLMNDILVEMRKLAVNTSTVSGQTMGLIAKRLPTIELKQSRNALKAIGAIGSSWEVESNNSPELIAKYLYRTSEKGFFSSQMWFAANDLAWERAA